MMGRLRRRVAEVLQVRQKGGRLSLLVDVLLIILISLSTLSIILESVDCSGRYFREDGDWLVVS
jgi:hypothetical protein